MAIERELMRSCLLEAMRRNPRTQFENLKYEVARVAAERGVGGQESAGGQPYLRREDHRRLRETVWALIVEGVMTVGMDDANESWPFLSLTEFGEEHVQDPTANPHDISEYLNRLRTGAPLDDIEERYLTQSLDAYARNLPDASAVMLGASSEHLLIELVADISTKDSSAKAGADKALRGPALGMLRFARDYFVPKQAKLPRELRENLETTFLGIAALVRTTRNDAGHPALPAVSREQCFVNLQVFPGYRAWIIGARKVIPL
jgi:hypothetical protein